MGLQNRGHTVNFMTSSCRMRTVLTLTMSVGAGLAWLPSCSSSTSSGCTKDTDCALGRICSADGRCQSVDAGSSDAGPSDSPGVNLTCLQYLEGFDRTCNCQCGTVCLTQLGYCGVDCTYDAECQSFWQSLGGNPDIETIYCDLNHYKCIFISG
jgi:hypothetical protein